VSRRDQPLLRWRKSSYSGGSGGECVEVAAVRKGLLIRDSKDPDGPFLELTYTTFHRLLSHLRAASKSNPVGVAALNYPGCHVPPSKLSAERLI
jgi:YD repeat-containing protein